MTSLQKAFLLTTNTMVLFFLAVPTAFAEEVVEAVSDGGIHPLRYVAAGIAITAAAGCSSGGQGVLAGGAIQAMARNPSLYSKLFTTMILTLAVAETGAIYGLVIALLCLYG
ncbi:MAG: ATP synthase F0 subunit C [Proteobacteria bacterium]|nr:ATP synthase F0 subunit C [Pseudomonadota bacterium]